MSIIILSALASEGGTYYSADLIDYYLVNFSCFDMIQDSRNAISDFDAQKLDSLATRGTPVALFKIISQDAIDSRVLRRDSSFEHLWIPCISLILCIIVLAFVYLNNQVIFNSRRVLLSLADSSPPIYC